MVQSEALVFITFILVILMKVIDPSLIYSLRTKINTLKSSFQAIWPADHMAGLDLGITE